MEIEQTSDQEIVVLRNRKKQLATLGVVSSPLVFLSVAFLLIALISHDLIFGIVALVFLLEFIGILWFWRRGLRLYFSDTPPLRINQQGITFIDGYQLSFKITLIPWPEIAKLSGFRSQGTLFTITLKDPQHWWSCAGDGRSRKFPPPHQYGGAQFAFTQSFILTSLPELLQRIQENYAYEIQVNEIKIVPFE